MSNRKKSQPELKTKEVSRCGSAVNKHRSMEQLDQNALIPVSSTEVLATADSKEKQILPFPALPDLKSTYLILSYLDFIDECKFLLTSLSHKTRTFLLRQNEDLGKHLVPWSLQIAEIFEVGDPELEWNDEALPKIEECALDIKLTSIKFLVRYG